MVMDSIKLKKETPLLFLLKDNGKFPNNDKLPLLIYKEAIFVEHDDPVQSLSSLVQKNLWNNVWHNGIYPFHHYHSTAHEVIIVYRGNARIKFGGEDGIVVSIHTSDALIIPAGIAHKNIGSSKDFSVLGAYPRHQNHDMCYGDNNERPRTDENIQNVPLPESDPIFGIEGAIMNFWYRMDRHAQV